MAEEREIAQQMQVCTCGGLFGKFVDEWHDSINRYQECLCQHRSPEPTEGRWERYDYNTAVELCFCCAAEVIRSGSKWSVFFCEDCRPRVLTLNKSFGMAVIPYGRHSIMNGFGLTGEDAEHPGKVAVFAKGLKTFFDRIDRLYVWRRNLVHDYLDALGESGNVSVEEYLTAALTGSLGRAESFHQLCRFFGVHPLAGNQREPS